MADDKIQIPIEVVLDDNSVKKSFNKIEKEAEKTGKGLGEKLDDFIAKPSLKSFENLTGVATKSLIGITAVATATGIAIQQALKFTLIGEDINRVKGNFDAFAQSVGLFGPKIREQLELASGGLVDLEQILDKSAGTFAELGANAAKLPQILETARNIGVATGKDVAEVFEGLNRAILTGNTRGLQQIGIFIKSNDVIDEYAKRMGIAKDRITEQVRQTAILEEITGRLAQRYAGVGEGLTPVKTAFDKLKVAADDLFDAIGLRANKAFGGAFATIVNLATQATSYIANKIGPETIDTVDKINKKIEELRATQIDINDRLLGRQVKIDAITRINGEIRELLVLREEINRKQSESMGDVIIQKEAEEQERLAAAAAATFLEYQKISGVVTFGPLTASASNADNAVMSLADNMATLGVAIQEESQKSQITFGELAKTIRGAFVGGISSAFVSVGKALATGGNAFEDFGKSVLNSIGGLAIQLGSFFILVGTGMSATGSLLGLSGGAAIAAGIGLTVLGGFLQSQGGGSSSGAGGGGFAGDTGSSSGGGGIATSPGGISEINDTVAEQKPNIQVVVQGNILDRRSSSLEIVDLLQEAFDTQGARVTGLA